MPDRNLTMAFRIDFSHSVASEVRRIVAEQFEYALDCLVRAQGPSGSDAVHEFRKTTKKLRALLRLLTGALPWGERHQWMQLLRLSAARLAENRDRFVLEQNLRLAYQELVPDADLSARPWSNLSALEQVQNHADHPLDSAQLRTMRIELNQVARQMLQSPQLEVDCSVLLQGAVHGYRRGRRLLREVSHRPTVQGLHDLRKRVKDQLYQVRLLSELSHKALRLQAVEFDQLAELLGEHHDLANLQRAIDASRATYRVIVELNGLSDWTKKRLATLEQDAIRLARHLYVESPKARARQLTGHHDAIVRANAQRAEVETSPLTVVVPQLQ
jgi:CHAD domain-containing protein